MTSRNHAKTDTTWEQEFQRRHLEMMAATIAAEVAPMYTSGQAGAVAREALVLARAIQEEVRKDG